MSIQSPLPQRPGDPHRKGSQEEEALSDTENVESLFDARPADTHDNRSLLTSALDALSKACRDAAAWITQVFSFIGSRDDSAIDISRPFNVKRGTLPDDLQKAIDEQLARTKASAARQEFVESAEAAPATEAAAPDPDREAFEAYFRLCKKERKAPGRMACPQNFADKAIRYAQVFVDMVCDRQAHAVQEKKEFWLGTEDQEKLKYAKALLKRAHGPIQTNTTQQLKSFMAWRDWSKHPAQLPDDTDFSIDAAVAYAHELCAVHAGKDVARDPRTKDLLGSAFALIAKEDHYRRTFEIQREAVDLVRELDELREPEDLPVAGDTTARDAPPAAPPPRTRSTSTASTSAPLANAPPQPSLRIPSARPTRPASWNALPELSTLDDELQAEAAGLLHRFFQRYVEKLDTGVLNFDDHPEYFSPLAASAAADFLQQADAQPGGTDVRSYAAANYLLHEFERRHAAPRPGS